MIASRWLIRSAVGFALVSLPACNGFGGKQVPPKLAEPAGQLTEAKAPPSSPKSPYHAESILLPGEIFNITRNQGQGPEFSIGTLDDGQSTDGIVRGQMDGPKQPAKTPPKPAEPKPLALPAKAKPEHPLVLAFEKFLEDQPAEAVKLLQVYKPKDQELLLRLMPLMARVAKGGLLTDQLSASEKESLINTLQALENDLQAASPLVLKHEGFCRKVKGFGQVERLASNQFKPGDQVLIYAEIHNLADHRVKDQFVTRLDSTLEVRSADCKVIRSQIVHAVPDVSESPREDHFTVIRFSIPAELQPGSYTLRVRIVDQDTQREAEKFLPFRVVGSTS